MKAKDYYSLARRSLKQRKKTTASTVRGLAIGFIILIPIIVILFGINVSISKQLNEVPYLLYMNVSMSDYRIETDNINDNGWSISGSKNIDYFVNNEYINNIVYEKHSLSSIKTEYSIGSGAYNVVIEPNDHFNNFYSIIDTDKSDSYFPQNLTYYYPGGIYLEGFDQGFTNEGKKQVVVSESFLTLQGVQASDAYLKPLTIKANSDYEFTVDEKTNISGYICNNYTIVGIIKSDFKELYSFENSNSTFSYMYSDLFFTSVNVYKNGVGVLKPRLTEEGQYSDKFKVFDNLATKDILNEEYMMLGLSKGSASSMNNHNRTTLYSTNIYSESESYKNLNKAIDATDSRFNNIFGEEAFAVQESPAYRSFNQTYIQVNMLTYLFSIVAVVIVFCAIINLFSTIKHSVTQRKFYLTMMRAIGARDSVIPKLYLTESAIIVSRANIFIASIGFTISALLKIVIDRVLLVKNISYDFSIPWLSIYVCVFTVVIAMYAISLLFAYICTNKLSKKPIVSILNKY